MSALVLDGHVKSALATVRSLGAKGIAVSVGAERTTAMALHSKFASARFTYPSPLLDRGGFVRTLKDEARRCGGKPLVYAFSDATWCTLYEFRDELHDCATLVFPDSKSVEIAFDKAATYSLARVLHIPTIPTYAPVMREEVRRLSEELLYPVVLKPRRSVTWKEGQGRFLSVAFVHSKESLVEQFEALRHTLGEAPLIQRLLLGEEYGVEILAKEGRIYARVVHHRIRSLSPTGGASVLKETLEEGPLRQILETHAEALVKNLLWSGPIMVEFKVDSDSREPHLMEINGRFWGSLPLSIASGVDMPHLFYRVTMEAQIPEDVSIGRDRVVTNHFLGDVMHLLRALFKRDPMRPLLYPRRFHAIRNFLFLPIGTKGDVWRWNDPKPSLMEIVDSIFRLRK